MRLSYHGETSDVCTSNPFLSLPQQRCQYGWTTSSEEDEWGTLTVSWSEGGKRDGAPGRGGLCLLTLLEGRIEGEVWLECGRFTDKGLLGRRRRGFEGEDDFLGPLRG